MLLDLKQWWKVAAGLFGGRHSENIANVVKQSFIPFQVNNNLVIECYRMGIDLKKFVDLFWEEDAASVVVWLPVEDRGSK